MTIRFPCSWNWTYGPTQKYATPAERQAAYRARLPLVELRVKPETLETIDALCESLDLSRNEVFNQLLQFALANRAWHTSPMFTSLLPRLKNPDDC